MKKILLAASVMVMFFVAIFATEENDANNGNAVVTGRGDALPEGVRVRLVKWEDGHSEYVATDTIANGQFRLELPVQDGLTICSLMFDYHAFPFIVHKLYLTLENISMRMTKVKDPFQLPSSQFLRISKP